MTLKSNSNGDFRFEHADEGISMVDLNMGLKMDAHNSYSFSSQALSCPSSCPSTAGSFSSASSHYDDPFTPTSRTSTPQQPISLDTSFDSDSLIFDFTPPPSASTGYFPPDLKSTVAPSMLSSHALPSTPSRCNNLFDTALSFDGLNFTPTQDMDSSYQFDPLGSSPFMIPTPPPPFNRSMQNCDLLSVWGQNADGSPITFSSPAVPLARQTPTPLGSSHSSSRRRVAMDRPQHSSAMLQQHLHQSSAKPRLSKPKSSTGKSNAPGQKGFRVNKNGAKVGFTEKSKHVCHLCKKAYTRQEHLKRHMAGRAHMPGAKIWTCGFCPGEKAKEFDRSDNFRDHLKRHASKSSGSRTQQNEGAAVLLAQLQSEMKTKKRRVIKNEAPAMGRPLKDIKDELFSPPLSSTLL